MQTVYPFEIKRISLPDGTELAYFDEGKGEVIIFIHGLAGYIPLWQFQLKSLQSICRTIAPDLPGNGLSDSTDHPYSIVFYAETIKSLVNTVGLKSVILAGHSMGGQIAMTLALRYPKLVKKLILIAPAGFELFKPAEITMMEHALELGQTWGLNSNYLDHFIHDSFADTNPLADKISSDIGLIASKNAQKWHQMIVDSIKSMLHTPIGSQLENIHQPTLVIFGEKDALIPNRLIHFNQTTRGLAYQGAALIENSELHLIPGAGHFVQIEKSSEVNNHIEQFLNSNP